VARFDETVELYDVVAKRQTDEALLCEIEEGDEIWIPRVQIDESSQVSEEGDEGTLVVSRWIADKKGLA
jgi:hypothetical protein